MIFEKSGESGGSDAISSTFKLSKFSSNVTVLYSKIDLLEIKLALQVPHLNFFSLE